MASLSAQAFDATVRHQVFLERLKAGQAADLTPYLREIDQFIRLKLTSGELTGYARQKLVVLLDGIDKMIAGELAKFEKGLLVNLNNLAVSESIFEAKSLTSAVNNDLFEAVVPDARQVRAAVFSSPLSVRGAQGGLLMEPFIKNWSTAQKAALVGAIRQGAFEGQTNAQIIQAIRGTKALGYKNGILGQTARQSEAMVRTAIQAVSGFARQATLVENSDLVKSYQWVSTLDNKTSEICQALSNRTWKVGEGPTPPAHINCRSTIVPVLDDRFKFLKEGATQSSQFGPVDANESFFSWLKKQPAAFQDATIGPTYAKLLRDGGLSAERFAKLRLSKNFKPLTLAEMQKLEPLAFQKAGIGINAATGRPISAVPPAPKAKPSVTSFNGPGAAVKQTAWANEWRKAGTFDTPRLATLANRLDDPGNFNLLKEGAYYSHFSKSINMGRHKPAEIYGRAVFRHEWGHYFDHMLGNIARNTGHFLHKVMDRFAGGLASGGPFISGMKVAAKALAADSKFLKSLGKRAYQATSTNKRIRVFPQNRINGAWQRLARGVDELGSDAVYFMGQDAKRNLAKSDHLIAKIWRELDRKGGLSMTDNVLFQEAVKHNDFSLLFSNRGKYLRTWMGDDVFPGFSDLIGAITNEEIGGYGWGFGHGKAYYADRLIENMGTEAFANMTDLLMARASNPVLDELIRVLVPNYANWYDELIDVLNGKMK